MKTAGVLADAPRLRSPMLPDDGFVRSYSVLGGVLRSSMPFPELPEVHGADEADWELEVRSDAPSWTGAEQLGERSLGSELYRLYRTPQGFRLFYSHAGCFDVVRDGASLRWYPSSDGSVELARAIVLGPALALSLELRDHLCLHGSAVFIGGQAIAFLGPKFHGKSTLALALAAAGATLISDDLIALPPGSNPTVRAGVPSVRLWNDSAAELEVERLCETVIPGAKTTASGFADRAFRESRAPLAAIYLLDPVPETHDPRPCWRTPLLGAAAAVALAHQTKLPPSLVGASRSGAQLRAAAATAARVPVWKLGIVRDFARLGSVVDTIMTWHGRDSTGPTR